MSSPPNATESGTDEREDGQCDGRDRPTEIGIVEARETVLDAAGDLLEHPLEGIIKAERTTDEDWRIVLEVLERQAVPDTQDLIGRYEFTVEPSGVLAGYGLVERYHRGDSKDEL